MLLVSSIPVEEMKDEEDMLDEDRFMDATSASEKLRENQVTALYRERKIREKLTSKYVDRQTRLRKLKERKAHHT